MENDLLIANVCKVLQTTKIFLFLKQSERKVLLPSVPFTHKVMHRSSHQRCSVRKGLLRNLAKFTVKHLFQSLFLNKVADLRPVTLSKKILWNRCFPVNFAKFLRTPFLQYTSGRLDSINSMLFHAEASECYLNLYLLFLFDLTTESLMVRLLNH